MNYFEKIGRIAEIASQNEYSERLCSEIKFLDALSKYDKRADNALIEKAMDRLFCIIDKYGCVVKDAVEEIEDILSPLSPVAKSYTEIFVSHAHIDMNWMWGYNETATLTVDTFNTILTLMEEYPEFTYAQSQASTYEIVEKFRPDMLEKIKARVHEGRWEVNACEWVEPDKNMPDGESLARQILQAKKYLTKLLDIPSEKICVDFVPDTFGHNANIPEILSDAGIKYMYHCRGYEVPSIYRFASPSGKETLNYCEYAWYNGEISTEKFEILPDFCGKNNVNTYLCVYGVGDHGGGPSRRDIERIIKYKSWPLTPNIKFGTVAEFFHAIEAKRAEFPVINHELNYLFTGCYTTQSRIKMANRLSEARINDAERLKSMKNILASTLTSNDNLDRAWRNILFNHFHDIIPGSGTVETREYAMGNFQETMAYVGTDATASMNAISSIIDTSKIEFDGGYETTSEGSGVGFMTGAEQHTMFPSTERGRGKTRAYTVFNPSAFERTEVVSINVWDYNYDTSRCFVTDGEGNNLEFNLSGNTQFYWGHNRRDLNVLLTVKPFGYATVILSQNAYTEHITRIPWTAEHNDAFINDDAVVLENNKLKAKFDKKTMQLISLVSKKSGEELINKKSCFFTLRHENAIYGMTAWRVGPTMSEENLNDKYDAKYNWEYRDNMVSGFGYSLGFGSSNIEVGIRLKNNADYLEYEIKVDWNEAPVQGKMIPQLDFTVPVSYKTNGKMLTDIPFGRLNRDCVTMDVPCLTYLQVGGESQKKVAIMADTKYGYRCADGVADIDLIRSSYDPDPYPERGIHHIKVAVAVSDENDVKSISERFNHPITSVSCGAHNGTLATSGSVIKTGEKLVVSAVKPSENGKGITFRLYNQSNETVCEKLELAGAIKKAYYLNLIETEKKDDIAVSGNAIEVKANALETITFEVEF